MSQVLYKNNQIIINFRKGSPSDRLLKLILSGVRTISASDLGSPALTMKQLQRLGQYLRDQFTGEFSALRPSIAWNPATQTLDVSLLDHITVTDDAGAPPQEAA